MNDTATPAPTTRIDLESILDVAAARRVAQSFRDARGSDLVVDASAVQRLGTQSAQVLVSVAASWRADGRSLQITGQTPAFADAVRLLGIGAHLPCEA